jgi:hypothetical protein
MNQIIKSKLYFPVTLDEAKRHLRVDVTFEQDDDYITGLIEAATLKAEQYIGKDIALTTNTLTIDDFYGDTLTYEEGNFNSLTSVIDTDASVLYTAVKIRAYKSEFFLDFDTVTIDAGTLVVIFSTGYNQGECPGDIKSAILIKIGDLYDIERQSYTFTSYRDTKAFENLLDNHKILIF